MIVRVIIAGLHNGETDLFAIRIGLNASRYAAYLNGDSSVVSLACTHATSAGFSDQFHVYEPDRSGGVAMRMKRVFDWAQVEMVTLVEETPCGAPDSLVTANVS